ncbi:WH2 domain-containing protein [Entamoeba marina]
MTDTNDTFSLKTKDDVKEIDTLTSNLLGNLSSVQPAYKHLIETCEAYSKAKTTFANCSSQLANALKSMSVNSSGVPEINTALLCVAGMLEAEANGHIETNKIFVEETILVFRREHTEMSKKIKDVEKTIKLERKTNEEAKTKATTKAEKCAKNPKKSDNLKELMENITTCETTLQKGITKGLVDTTNLLCEMYCKIVTGMFLFLEKQQSVTSGNALFLEKNTPRIKKLSKTKNVWPRRVKELMTNKKQILIDTTWLSPELKQILKDAGVKRRDLANPDTVQMLINIITEQVTAGNIPQEILSQLQRTDKTPEIHQFSTSQTNAPPVPPSPRSRHNVPVPPTPPKPNFSAPRPNGSASNNATPPPPPPPRRGMAAPNSNSEEMTLPPLPAARGGTPSAPSLLDQIQQGKQLKKVEDIEDTEDRANLNTTQKVDLTSLLASAMQKRREDIAEEDEEEDDDYDSEEWDD